MKSKHTLICDTREKMVTRHDTMNDINIMKKQITIGDYAIINPEGGILAIIERKTLEDFSASLKDGRHSNKQKLITLREKTNCSIIFIIEGAAFPAPTEYFGGIPYKCIESSIFHLMIRDNITVMRTKDSLHTAQVLSRFVISMDSLNNTNATPNTIDIITEDNLLNDNKDDKDVIGAAMEILTERVPRRDIDIVRELWSCFPGISMESATDYINHWSIADIVCGKIDRVLITKFKLYNNRTINKKAAMSLCGVTAAVEIKLLSAIPGMSTTNAKFILEKTPLCVLLLMPINEISAIMGKNNRRLGDKLAERITKLFNMSNLNQD